MSAMTTKPSITPSTQRIGRVEVELSLGSIARMFAAEEWEQPDNAVGGAVFAGRVHEVLLNLPRDTGDVAGPADQFNLDAKICDPERHHPVPYLDVRAEVSRDGQAVLTDIPLVPVARPQRGVDGFHYGNNVRLAPSGRYDVVVRIAAGPLVGADPLPAARFSVAFE